MKKILFFIVILTLGCSSLASAFEAVILGGTNRIKRVSSQSDRYLLIEKDKIVVKNSDILKTKNKGYILVEDQNIRIIIYPFSEVQILDAASRRYRLLQGTIWIENTKGGNNQILLGKASFSSNPSTVSYISYQPAQPSKLNESVLAVTLKGSSNLMLDGKSYQIVDYQKVEKTQNGITSQSFIPIDNVASFAQVYSAYRSKVTGWKADQIEKEKLRFKLSGKFTKLSKNDTDYIIAAIQPRFKYKKFAWGFIIPFYIDYNNSAPYKPSTFGNYGEWNFDSFSDALSDLVLKIDYFRYGEKYKTDLYVNAGNISEVGIKNSLIMSSFKPNLNYPQRRQLSLELGYNSEYWGIEAFAADFSSAEIFGFRSYAKPFLKTEIFRKLEVGMSLVIDADPEDKREATGDTQVYFLGFDLNMPIYNLWETATINFLLQWTKAFVRRDEAFSSTDNSNWKNARGMGISYGLTGTILDRINYSFGGLILRDEFPDSYFDALYLSNRKTKLDQLLDSNREKNEYGIYSTLAFDFENLFKFDFSYRQVLKSEITEGHPDNKFSFNFYLYPAALTFAYIEFSYDRHGIKNFSDFKNNFFSSDLSTISATLILPLKLKYLEYHLSYNRSFVIGDNSVSVENYYESGIEFNF